MCKIINDNYTEEKIVTGYKVVIVDKHKHYYSPVTGIRYESGKAVKIPKKYGKHNVRRELQFMDILDPTYGQSHYIGFTAAFKRYDDAVYFMNQQNQAVTNLIVVKMQLSGHLKTGTYSGKRLDYDFVPFDTYLGNFIESITSNTK